MDRAPPSATAPWPSDELADRLRQKRPRMVLNLGDIIWRMQFVEKLHSEHAVATDEVESLLFGRPHLLRIRRGRVKGEDVYEEFGLEEEAGRFWDTHDSSEYLDQMEPVEADVRLERRRFEIQVDAEAVQALGKRAATQHVTASRLANELLRRGLSLH